MLWCIFSERHFRLNSQIVNWAQIFPVIWKTSDWITREYICPNNDKNHAIKVHSKWSDYNSLQESNSGTDSILFRLKSGISKSLEFLKPSRTRKSNGMLEIKGLMESKRKLKMVECIRLFTVHILHHIQALARDRERKRECISCRLAFFLSISSSRHVEAVAMQQNEYLSFYCAPCCCLAGNSLMNLNDVYQIKYLYILYNVLCILFSRCWHFTRAHVLYTCMGITICSP